MIQSTRCESCVASGVCQRRNQPMPRGRMYVCAKSVKQARNWDAMYGVVDSSVIPPSLVGLPPAEEPEPQSKKKSRRSRSPRPVGKRKALRPQRDYTGDRGLGDMAESAFNTVGITQERAEKVAAWFGLTLSSPTVTYL